ncbi:cell division protein FtsQ [Oikeobacillus pervagus]|uniref:Cell division protein DivIB n=1 Tax=Oikeobacillus pervagus TaxID=1325931 RepID=A0AAJ1T3H6_9BACI|nr:FtsQ-type POTRA domain-containing protein [Oikeobacillus pervagus]MDQ0215244.1 cell division protein FtsQ [Oikeobacillus pervagus]
MEKGKVVSIEDRIPKLKQQKKKKTNRRLLLLLSIFFLLILTVVYFQSPLSHIRKISVSGNVMIPKDAIIKITGIKKGMSIWELDREVIESQLKEKHEIRDAKVKVSFPNSVKIIVREQKRLAYISDGTSFRPVLENGKVVDHPVSTISVQAPVLYSFKNGKILKEMMTSLNQIPTEIVNAISEIHYSPKKTDKYHIKLYMNDGFEVTATLRTFAEKMIYYPSIISQLDPHVKGVIDLEVGSYFKAYEVEGDSQNEE